MTDLPTPALLLDRTVFERNLRRLKERTAALGVALRPHMKTAKSVDVWREVVRGSETPITVSTLKEAEQFAAAGARDILYAIGIEPGKFERVRAMHAGGTDLSVITDNEEAAEAIAASHGEPIPVLIEIDVDGQRAGIRPDDAGRLVAIGRMLDGGAGTRLRGVMTHAGGSYGARGAEALAAAAEEERSGAVAAAETLREAGLPCPIVSVGSTPTAMFARDLSGVTELRAGVYMFADLVMAGLGVCGIDDIALSVEASVIGHQRDKGWIIVDAGWMALSRDRGTQRQAVDQGYGLVCREDGEPYEDLIVIDTNQEHGIIARRPGSTAPLPDLPIGARVRILPNHACATAAQHDRYHVLAADGALEAIWPRFSGW